MEMHRRSLLMTSGAFALGLPWLGASAQSAPEDGDPLTFAAFRNGSTFGHHHVRFSKDGPRLIIDIEIRFDVKFAFIPFYRYRHRNREVWEDGRLIGLSTETDDNGTPHRVAAKAVDDRLLVESDGGTLDLPGDTLPTSYWSETIGRRGTWLDTQKGELVRSSVIKEPEEMIEAAGQMVSATPYQLEGDITCRLWYSDGYWVKLRFEAADGSLIDYALQPSGRGA